VKYGALATHGGHITVTWHREQDEEGPRMRLEWVESGVALDSPPAHRGFGQDLIERTVPYELRGAARLMFEPGGVRCIIDIPLNRHNVIAEPMAIG
jgi:two-component system CheB/CheR fusion protein